MSKRRLTKGEVKDFQIFKAKVNVGDRMVVGYATEYSYGSWKKFSYRDYVVIEITDHKIELRDSTYEHTRSSIDAYDLRGSFFKIQSINYVLIN